MYSLTALLAFAALVAAQAPTIATPAAVVQCQPAQISFVATNTPVFISIIPGGQPSAAPLQDLGQQNASPFTWVASIASGTQITFQIRDSTGAVAYSAPVTIQTSSDSSCIGATTSGAATGSASQTAPVSSASGSASSSVASVSSAVGSLSSSVAEATSSIAASVSSAASSAVSSATAPATTSRASTSVASTSRTATATSAATSPSTSSNSARSNMQVGFAGLFGLVAAAVMA